MNTKPLLLGLAAILISIGIFKPNLSFDFNNQSSNNTVLKLEKPSNSEILDECEEVIQALKDGPSSRKVDGQRLASLYLDMSTLVSLDGEDEVIKNTDEIRQANRLAGAMLRLNIKGKYPSLAKAAESVIVSSIGDDHVLLDSELRQGAADGFKALAWACAEGAK